MRRTLAERAEMKAAAMQDRKARRKETSTVRSENLSFMRIGLYLKHQEKALQDERRTCAFNRVSSSARMIRECAALYYY